MKAIDEIQEVRNSGKNLRKNINGRTAVIVSTEYEPKKSYFGIQYWTDEMIKKGSSINTDKTTSKYIETL